MTAGAHILVVDDDATNRKLLSTLLTYEGYRVTEASDGAEGLIIARGGDLGLVISDILMPSMDGYEFFRTSRADPITTNLAVIFYHQYHEREATSLARQCGVARVLVKPCAAPVFVKAVADALAGVGAAQSPAEPDPGFDAEHMRLLTDKLSQKADALRVANSRLSMLTKINLQMSSERDAKILLSNVCVKARELLGGRFAVLAVVDKAPTRKKEVCISGLSAQLVDAVTDPREDLGLLRRVYAENRVERLASTSGAPLDLGLPTGFPAVQAAVAAPVCSLSRTYGWLCVCDKLGTSAFNSQDERLLTIIAAQLGRISRTAIYIWRFRSRPRS